ncbi:MAG: LUD domain-containing protein [Clostridia bacterium]|nr:LUD domain-containing protein [Clostridia bacterium]
MQKTKRKLKKKGYQVSIFENKEDATNYIDSQIDKKTIGFGGSITIHQMNLYEILSKHNKVYWHDNSYNNCTFWNS